MKEIQEKKEIDELNKKYNSSKAKYKDVNNRLYYKEAEKIKERLLKEKKEKEKKKVIDWDKINLENNKKKWRRYI